MYSDDHRQEAESVIKVALDTQREIQKRNPEINLDIVDALLPVLPPKTSGPHDQIPNANQIPVSIVEITYNYLNHLNKFTATSFVSGARYKSGKSHSALNIPKQVTNFNTPFTNIILSFYIFTVPLNNYYAYDCFFRI